MDNQTKIDKLQGRKERDYEFATMKRQIKRDAEHNQ